MQSRANRSRENRLYHAGFAIPCKLGSRVSEKPNSANFAVRSSRELGGIGLSEVQIETIGTGSCGAAPLTVVYSEGNRKLGFVLIEAPPGMRGGFFVAVEP